MTKISKSLLDKELLQKAKQDDLIMNDLLYSEDVTKFIKYVIKTYTKSPAKFMLFNRIEFQELMHLAQIGLYKGIMDVDFSKTTNEIQRYFYLRIQGEVREVARSNDSNQIVIPQRIRGLYTKYLMYHNQFYTENLRDPSIEEVMDKFSISDSDAYDLVYGMQATISDIVEQDGQPVNLLDVLAVKYFDLNKSIEQQVINKLVLEERLCLLKDKERTAIEMKYLFGYNDTEISRHLSCSSVMISKYLKTALEVMTNGCRKVPYARNKTAII